MDDPSIRIISLASSAEEENRMKFRELFRKSPVPEGEFLENLGLYLKRQDLTRILFMNELYQKILGVHGIIVEFGVRWGQNLALFESLRGIYEPYNYNRKIVGFDTFAGFPTVHPKDGGSEIISPGSFSVTRGYEEYLSLVLEYHERESPVSHIQKFRLVKGDATVELPKYLEENPETIIALAYFDFDIYEPTKKCLEGIQGHLTRGSVIGFDELNVHDYPGETLAVKETLGLSRYRIERSRFSSVNSYCVID